MRLDLSLEGEVVFSVTYDSFSESLTFFLVSLRVSGSIGSVS